MKISDIVKRLSALYEHYGDLDVMYIDNEFKIPCLIEDIQYVKSCNTDYILIKGDDES
jgi:hypothetical protein